ncbi:PREDICTED: LOW QUALITY PROTEIN: uncharacterized protein LOC105809264 [Propithecus coquereli]|uniref:LOW QUALITY PROTEIN: uncharacterized protein LOC105809264 n=1 Tax=Propithecus coquereli TaxID=379532 RepID=UPI00063F5365|nr:PREDICTED: LOW QUALITY PROTEIN: uncharacterized protein LOC105809264 [Propithecus coquereli]
MASDSTLSDLVFSWEEDRKFILRSWSLVFSILATLLALSVMDGRMAYMKGPYDGYLGFWTNCRRHKCANLGQVTVLIHMSKGFMLLALGLCFFLLPAMGLSFQPFFRRLHKVDFVFSSLSISIGLLIFLSLTLFAVNCETVHPRPRISYLVTFYLCWCASALMLWAAIAGGPCSIVPRGSHANTGSRTSTLSVSCTCPIHTPSRIAPKSLRGIAPELLRTPTGSSGQMLGRPLQCVHTAEISPPLRPHSLIPGHVFQGQVTNPHHGCRAHLCGSVSVHWVLTVPPFRKSDTPSRSAPPEHSTEPRSGHGTPQHLV